MNTAPAPMPVAGAPEIQAWLIDYITAVIDTPKEDFPVKDTFVTYGLDSVELTIMCGMLEEAFSVTIQPEELFEHPSVAQLSEHVASKLAGAPAASSAAS